MAIGLTGSFIIIVLSCFSWWYRAWSPTPSPARRCNTDSCWKRKYLNIFRQAHCRVLVLIFLLVHFFRFFRAVTQKAQFVNDFLSGFLYLLIVIVVRVHLHDSVGTLNVTTRKSRMVSNTNRISIFIGPSSVGSICLNFVLLQNQRNKIKACSADQLHLSSFLGNIELRFAEVLLKGCFLNCCLEGDGNI